MITADENNQKENKGLVNELITVESLVSKRIMDQQKQFDKNNNNYNSYS